ncbi:hypothetical protein ACFWIW_10640 [Amycolatopsis sp. NPDC058340]|uniref:hypothetical protein n=1 Tax=Amycolatopsis sp. NPDC058340 TaxID=3346453 RepID=UPI0036660C4C
MSNDVRINVHWNDRDGDKFAAAQKAKARKAGEGAGDEFSGTFTVRARKGTEKATDAIANELNRSQQKIAAVGEKLGGAAGDGIEKGAREGARRGGAAVDGEMSRVAGRANKAFDAKLFTGLSVGLPAAAAIGAAGAAAVLALPAAAAIGVAGMILQSNEQISGSYGELAGDIVDDATLMAQVLKGPVLTAASDLHDSWDRLAPVAKEAFGASAGEVKVLTGAVTDLAEGALPGMVTGLKGSHQALVGVRAFAGEAGHGLGEFFANASKGSSGAGQGMAIFGGTVRMVEGRLGTLFANLANGSSGPLTQLHVFLDLATDSLLDLTSQGGAAISFLNGFGAAGGGAMAVLSGLVTLLNALPQGVTQFGGSLLAASMIASKFGLDIGRNFEGIGAKVRAAGNDLNGIERGAAKAGTAVGALAGAAFSPATLAVAALSAGLMILGQEHQDAAGDASAQAARVRDLSAALRESKGAITESVRAKAADKLANFQLHDGTRNLILDTQKLAGASGVQLLTSGYLGNTEAAKQLVTQLRGVTEAHTHVAGGAEALTTRFERLGIGVGGTVTAMDDTGFAAKQLADIVENASGEFGKAADTNKALGVAAQSGAKSMTALESAMDGMKDAASGSEEKLSALVDVMNILEGRNATFEESIQAGNDSLRAMETALKDGMDKADGFGKALLNADGSLNTFTANGSQLQDLATGLQTSFAKAGTSIDEMVRKGMPFDEAVKKVNDGLAVQRDRFVDIAQKMGLTKDQAQALADKYGLIPKEITTYVTADTKQGKDAIAALPEFAQNTKGAVSVTADINRATNQISSVVEYADGSTGVVTIDAQRNPANNQIEAAVQFANGSRGFLTIDGFIQAAKNRTLEAKRNADGTVSWIVVDANTTRANAAINNAARNRTATITVNTQFNSGTGYGARPAPGYAKGGLVGYASGGQIRSVPKFADGGSMLDIRAGGLMRGPGTGTSDSILALSSRGPIAGSNGEMVIRASQARKWGPLLQDINNGVNGFAGGGLTGAAQEALSHLEGGGSFSEDFSFRGGSANMGAFNDQLADMFYKARPGYDFNANSRGDVIRFLRQVVGSAAASAQAARGGQRSGGGPVVLEVQSSGHPLDDFIAELIRRYVRVKGGGNVQAAFGRG